MSKLNILQRAMSAEVLDQTWRRLKKEHTPWSVKVTRDELQVHLFKHVLQCREQVLAGTYKPQPLRQFAMKKPDGKNRVLSAQYLVDKFVQRAILIVLEPKMEQLFHDDSYAYRPKRSVAMALLKVKERITIGQDWLVDADIKSFFDSIPLAPLTKTLKSFIDDKATLKLIEQWLMQGAHHQSFLATKRGISQGAILSPLFCNLYLHSLDRALSRANIPFVRFADDLLLFSSDQKKAEQAQQFLSLQLCKLGLILHPEKTQIVKSNPDVIFLGESLPSVPHKNKR